MNDPITITFRIERLLLEKFRKEPGKYGAPVFAEFYRAIDPENWEKDCIAEALGIPRGDHDD